LQWAIAVWERSMTRRPRPLADRIEVGVPRLAALAAQALGRLPERLRRRVLQAAFDRARDAFNRGDLEVVFALFAADVEYGPPPPLHEDGHIRGRSAVLDFWHDALARYDESTIENLSLDEAARGCIVRRARLRHRSSATGESFAYVIVQTTELQAGRVVRQINVLDHEVDEGEHRRRAPG
jgi:ketosteroid isomerase-like protein